MITIHCGLHKTGSSSIQLALASFRGSVRVVVPRPGDDQSLEAWSQRLAASATAREAVLSDEKLLGSAFDAYAAAPERVAMLRSAMSGTPFRIVVYFRPQLEWLSSVYLQGVQEGRSQGSYDFWRGIAQEPFLLWSRLLGLLRESSGARDVVVRAYAPGRDVVADLFRAAGIGVPPRVGPGGHRENVSISAVQAPILAALNLDTQLTDSERSHLRRVFQDRLAVGAPRRFSPFSEDVQRVIIERFREDWVDLAGLVDSVDPREAEAFRACLAGWDQSLLPYAGAGLSDEHVLAELLRGLGALAMADDPQRNRTLVSRLSARLAESPGDLPAAVWRQIRRPK